MRRFLTLSVFLLICIVSVSQANEARLLRFPDVHGDMVSFVYAGDIYTAPRAGGQATRLTSHEGLELFPRFSPDGSQIAFTGQYDGDQAVYVMPTTGGDPVRLTWHPGFQNQSERMGPENIVMDWHPDGKRVLFRSRKEAQDVWDGKAYLVSTEGGLPVPLPMKTAGFTSLSPNADQVAYCPIFRDFRTWKRYMGGMAQDVWIFDLNTLESERITDWTGSDNIPMWHGDNIYFNSDRTGTLNLFCYNTVSGETRQVTDFTEYDVRWPAVGPDGIAFENGGYIYVLDLPTEQLHKVEVSLTYDSPWMRPEYLDVSDDVDEFDIAPDGKRAVLRARGDLFSVPTGDGNTLNLTGSSNANERHPRVSPDGTWIACVSDATGEDELYLLSADGSETRQLTNDGYCWKFRPAWSPDSQKLVFANRDLHIYVVDVNAQAVTMIDQPVRDEVRSFSWSPDSRYIAYSKTLDNDMSAIFVYAVEDGRINQVTPGLTNDYAPEFDPDGKYLYFLSQRSWNPILSNYEFQFVNQSMTDLYLILLSSDQTSPFAPKEDSADEDEDEDSDGDRDGRKKSRDKEALPKTVTPIRIDFDGIYDREVAFDLPAGNYGSLRAISNAVFYVERPLSGLRGRITDENNSLHKYDLKKEKDAVFADNVRSYELTADGKKMLLRHGRKLHVVKTAGQEAKFKDNALDLGHMEMRVDRRAEYMQIFDQAWRMNRDFFYDANMHGVDWPAMRDRYRPLVPYAAHRFDLTYIIGEMIGELCCSHTYTGGGDMPRMESSRIGLLGCDFAVDTQYNAIQIARILKGENWDESLRSPLEEPGIAVSEGDYILAINGQELGANVNPYSLTQQTIGQHITLTVNHAPTMRGARKVQVRPVASEGNLRYFNWVEDRKAYVDSVSDGRIGYIHIPDMGGFGLTRFTKMFYHQMKRPGLIIDVRYNGGGFVSGLILDRLRKTLVAMGGSRTFPEDRAPGNAIYAHMITLLNQQSCSDGDYFPYFFREYGLGPLMGVRSWGGVIGIRGGNSFTDGGYCTVPEFGLYDLDGNWTMENEGVHPDMVVENLPTRMAQNFDDQLDAALEYIQNRLTEDPKTLPSVNGPPAPR